MTHSTSLDAQPGSHPSWCVPTRCEFDATDVTDPHLHGSKPMSLITTDAEFEIGTLASTTEIHVSFAATSSQHTCGCGAEMFFVGSLSRAEVMEMVHLLTVAEFQGGEA